MAAEIGPGTLVECIANHFGHEKWCEAYGIALPQVGRVYTVRSIEPAPISKEVGLYLVEVRNPPAPTLMAGWREPAFTIEAFRPVRDDSLDIFRQAIKDVDDKVTA